MAILLLDSTVLFDHLNGRNGRTELLSRLVYQGHLLACCPVNVTEVYSGLRAGEEQGTEAFLDSLKYLPVTPAIAKHAGLLRRDWRAKGHTLSYSDVTIAAVAIANQSPLLTDNQKHFPMPEVNLFAWPDR